MEKDRKLFGSISDMPKISLVLPTYNMARYIPESISSVMSQTFQDYELIIIDDGSTDDTQGIVQQYLQHTRIIYIKKEHGGPASARNRGLQIARGEYIAFLDADDIYARDKLEKQIHIMDTHPIVDIVYTSERYFYDADRSKVFKSPFPKISGDLFIFLIKGNFITMPTIMIRRSSLGGITFDDAQETITHEDWDFLLKLAFRGDKFFCINEELTFVRLHKNSTSADTKSFMLTHEFVRNRALALWNEFKRKSNLKSRNGFLNLMRFISLKMRAFWWDFPNAQRFHKPFPKSPIE